MSPSLSYDHGAINEQIADRVSALRAAGLLVFLGGEALDVLRKHAALPGPHKPKLCVHCERDVGLPPEVYDDFVPQLTMLDGSDGSIEVYGTMGPRGHRRVFRFDTLQLADKRGRNISFVTAQPQHARWHELLSKDLWRIR